MSVGGNRQFAGVLPVVPDERRAGAGSLPEDEAAGGTGLGCAAHAATVAWLAGRRFGWRVAVQMDDLTRHG